MKASGAHTHPDDGGGGLALVIIVVAIICAAIAKPVADAAVAIVHVLLIVVFSLIGLAAAAGIGVWAWRSSARRAYRTTRVSLPAPPPQRAVEMPAASRRVLPPPQPQIHLHLHGPVTAADVAELIARQGQLHGSSYEHAAIEENQQ